MEEAVPMSREGSAPGNGTITVVKKELIWGLVLFASGLVLPAFLKVQHFGINEKIAAAMRAESIAGLLRTAYELILLNILRGLPLYIGVFFLGDSIRMKKSSFLAWLPNAVLLVALTVLSYILIGLLFGIHYDFGLPAMIMTVFVIFFGRLNFRYIQLWKKALSVGLFLCAVQFLDIMPFFCSSSAYFPFDQFPIGRGETSQDIKNALILLEQESLGNAAGLLGFLLFALAATLYLMELRLENDLKEMNSLREQNHRILMAKHESEIQNRLHQEVRYLVHDLKSPLTAMQTMVGVMKLSPRDEAWDEECLDRMEESMEQMNRMISEIMSNDTQNPVRTEEIVHTAMAQLSVMDFEKYIRVENAVPEAVVLANKILLSRAIVNLLQNSAKAIPAEREPSMKLTVSRKAEETGAFICFAVRDNGVGMEEPEGAVWERGVSGSSSSGLGLAFVAEVVHKSGGQIHVESGENGTTIVLEIPEEEENE